MMDTTCPDCLRPVGECNRCGEPIVESRWASAPTPRGHEHYHPRCLSADELRAYQAAGRRMFDELDQLRSGKG